MNSMIDQWLYRAALREEMLKEAGIIPQGIKNLAGKIGHTITAPARAARKGLGRLGDYIVGKAEARFTPKIEEALRKELNSAISTVKEQANTALQDAGGKVGKDLKTKITLPLAVAGTLLGGGALAAAVLLRKSDKRKLMLQGLGVIDADEPGKR